MSSVVAPPAAEPLARIHTTVKVGPACGGLQLTTGQKYDDVAVDISVVALRDTFIVSATTQNTLNNLTIATPRPGPTPGVG